MTALNINWSDPCVVAPMLRAAYYQLLAGAGPVRVRIENREVQFAATDLEKLQTELAAVEARCAAQQGAAKVRNVVFRSPAHRGW
jgi:hypothetical protein